MTATLVDFVPPAEQADSDNEPNRCQYDGCTNPTAEYSGRGPKPKFCTDHKGNKPAGESAGTRAPSKRNSWPNAENIEKLLTQYFDVTGMAISFVNPADGTVIATGGPAIAHELVELGRQDKKLRDFLEKLTKPGKYGPLVIAVSPVVIGLMANHGLLPQFSIPTTNEGSKPND